MTIKKKCRNTVMYKWENTRELDDSNATEEAWLGLDTENTKTYKIQHM